MLRTKPLAILKLDVSADTVPKVICRSPTFYVHICAVLQQHINKKKSALFYFQPHCVAKVQHLKSSMRKLRGP